MLRRIISGLLRRDRIPPAAGVADSAAAFPLASARRLIDAGRHDEARLLLDQIVVAEPGNADAHRWMGELHLRTADPAAATTSFRGALICDPRHADAWFGLATATQRAGDLHRAHLYMRTALRVRPRDADILNELGLIELEFGNYPEAESAFEDALNAAPDHFHAWNNLGMAFAARGQLGQARRCFRRAVGLKADFYVGLCNLGLACRHMELLEEAESALREAAACKPHDAQAWLNLGSVLQDRGRLDEAHDALEVAHVVAPRDVAVLAALGDLQLKRGQSRAAEQALAEALKISPEDAEARLALAHVRLAEGDFAEGWPLYEARLAGRSSTLRRYPVPAWSGTSLSGRSVLVYGEQGLGDEILFASMLPDLLRETAYCRLVCEARLKPLFARSFPGLRLLREAEARRLPASGADFCLPIGSLGKIYRSNAAAFPRHDGYLSADPALVQSWCQRLNPAGKGLRIGISWRGGLHKTGRAVRSFAVESLAPLLNAAPAQWVSLQHDATADERLRLESMGNTVAHWDEVGADLEHAAALITALDLVITVCSSVVHLSGALGRPTWVLTSHAPAWRYQLQGETMPWYPAVRLFRQPRPGDWASVISSASQALVRRSGAP